LKQLPLGIKKTEIKKKITDEVGLLNGINIIIECISLLRVGYCNGLSI